MESKQALTGSMSAWQSNSKTRNNLDFRNASQEQRLQLIRQATAFSGHDFFLLVSACLDGSQITDNEIIDVTKAFVETHCSMDHMPSMNEISGAFSDWDWISMLFDRLPEKAMRQLLRAAITTRAELADDVVMNLDESMQGQLYFESHIQNRLARIAFACSGANIIYMREAAGGKNVWMDDEEFTRLVELDDSSTFACFARSEQMKPHHLLFIQHKLAADPHQSEFLASSYETKITLMKALEMQGNSQELTWMRSALEARNPAVHSDGPSDGCLRYSDAGVLWRNYVEIKNQAVSSVPRTPLSTKDSLPVSTAGPVRTSTSGRHLLN